MPVVQVNVLANSQQPDRGFLILQQEIQATSCLSWRRLHHEGQRGRELCHR